MVKAKAQKTKTAANSDTSSAAKLRRVNTINLPIPTLSEKKGNLLVCGQNELGQLGFNPDDVLEKTRPALQAQVADIVDVKAGGLHSLCLTKDGRIWTFGCNDEGALGRITEEEGSDAQPHIIELPAKVVKISAGDSHSACILEDGRVFAWGSFRDSHGTMGLTTQGNKKFPVHVVPEITAADIASGNDHLVILAQNGQIYTIGCAEQGQLGRVTARTLTGESRSGNRMLLTPGRIPKKAGNFIANAIWATPFCTFLRENGTDLIYGFGLNNYCQLGVPKKGKEFEHFPALSKFKNVKSIAGGQHHSIVLDNDNKVYAIGRRDYGRLGLGDVPDDIIELAHVTTLNDTASITCGESNSFALTKDGKVFVWGMGTSSQLGTGDEEDVPVPKLLVGAQVKDKNIFSLSSGGQHSLFIVEVPEANEKVVKSAAVKTVEAVTDTAAPVISSTTEPAPKKGNAQPKGQPETKVVGRGNKRKQDVPVIMESDSTTDVNGNSAKDQKMDVDSATNKRARKRKA